MKRMMIAGVAAVLICAVCIAGCFYIDRCNDRVLEPLNAAFSAAKDGDFDTAASKSKEAEDVFVSCEGKLSMFIDHELLAAFGESVCRLPELATEDTADDFLAECRAAIVNLGHIVDAQRPTLDNIM